MALLSKPVEALIAGLAAGGRARALPSGDEIALLKWTAIPGLPARAGGSGFVTLDFARVDEVDTVSGQPRTRWQMNGLFDLWDVCGDKVATPKQGWRQLARVVDSCGRARRTSTHR